MKTLTALSLMLCYSLTLCEWSWGMSLPSTFKTVSPQTIYINSNTLSQSNIPWHKRQRIFDYLLKHNNIQKFVGESYEVINKKLRDDAHTQLGEVNFFIVSSILSGNRHPRMPKLDTKVLFNTIGHALFPPVIRMLEQHGFIADENHTLSALKNKVNGWRPEPH